MTSPKRVHAFAVQDKTACGACAEDERQRSRKRGKAEEAAPVEDEAPQNKRSRTGRVIVPPAGLEEALTPAPAVHPGRVNRQGTGGDDATPEEALQPVEAQQKGRRKGRKSAKRVEWLPAPAEQLVAAQKVRPSAQGLTQTVSANSQKKP